MLKDDKPLHLLGDARGSLLERGLAAARTRGPTDAELRELRQRVLAGVGLMAGAATARAPGQGPKRAPALGKGWLTGSLTKVVLGVAVFSSVSVASLTYFGTRHSVRPPVRHVPPASPEPFTTGSIGTAGSKGKGLRAPEIAPSVSAGTSLAAASTGGTAPDGDSGEDELGLLEHANQVLDRDPALALALTRECHRRFPDGSLGQEREVGEIAALTLLHRPDEAKRAGARFLRKYPRSAYASKVRGLLGGSD